MGKTTVHNRANTDDGQIEKDNKAIPAVRHFNYREKRKQQLHHLHEYAGEMDAMFDDLTRRRDDKAMDLSSQHTSVGSDNSTQLSAFRKDVNGKINVKSTEIPADRHLNYRNAVYQHEFNLHEYIAEREERIRDLIREKEETAKDFRVFNELSKDAIVLANQIEGKVNEESTQPLTITSAFDGQPLSLDDLFRN